ncbi:C40 family peptidase [Cellulomonas endophytica]|uniref:C40 family peptidase n=1 Tax=Cellulomonas endophytica TaxID=2494735 RepID=UPI001F0C76DB|nr:C40 family peptidase [Cellulomonas endophytica]
MTVVVLDRLPRVGQRAGAVAASCGLTVSILAAPAAAAPSGAGTEMYGAVDTTALVVSARQVMAAAPLVTAPAEATWTFDAPAVTAVTPPPPPPEPVVEEPEPEPELQETLEPSSAEEPAPEAAAEDVPAPEEPTVTEAVGAPAPASANGSAVVEIAAGLVGVPYVWGGTTPAGFDCSGFTSYVYAQIGVSLPRTSSAQRGAGTVVPREQAQPGDLIWTPGHIAIFAGGNLQVDAPVPGKTIQIREIWQANPTFIRVG